MCGDSFLWLLFPLMFFGMMIVCMIFFRRRGRWFCCTPYYDRSSDRERIRKLEDEIRNLKGRQ